MALLNIITGPFLLGGGLGDEAFAIGMYFLLTGSSLGIVGLITSFYRNYRGMAIGFSVAAICVWLLELLWIFMSNGYNYQWVIDVMSRWSSLLIMYPPLLLALASLIIQQCRNRKPDGILWIALIGLGLTALVDLLLWSKYGSFAYFDAALSAILIIGLYLRHKWAYVLTIVIVALYTIQACLNGIGLAIAALNSLILIPILLCTQSFFGKSPAKEQSPIQIEEASNSS